MMALDLKEMPNETQEKIKKRRWRSKPKLKKDLWEKDPHCYWCGTLISLEKSSLDHLTPRSKGGSNQQSNIVLACMCCNRRRGNTLPGVQLRCNCGNMLSAMLISRGIKKCRHCLTRERKVPVRCECGFPLKTRSILRGITKCGRCLMRENLNRKTKRGWYRPLLNRWGCLLQILSKRIKAN